MDLSKLTPAPWECRPENCGGWCDEADKHENQEFIALARNAFDVMIRRKDWSPIHNENPEHGGVGWHVAHSDSKVADSASSLGWCFPGPWPDPFTALVEADAWYKANVES
jgi:hypothetical protein